MKVLEKQERRLGERLLLKGERCAGPKCAGVRRAYPPGAHGKTRRRRRNSSEFSVLAKEKQKVRYLYGLDDKSILRYSTKAANEEGIFGNNFLRLIEGRLDNVVYRLNFTDSRRTARQLVSHGHITVDKKVVSIPSFMVKKGQVISIKDTSRALGVFANLDTRLKKYEPPKWLTLDKPNKAGTVLSRPNTEARELSIDASKIREFYSR